jgi:His-Xaa-Ser system protein HxsD
MGGKMKIEMKTVQFAKGLYSQEALKLAAYVFLDRAEIKLSVSSAGCAASFPAEDAGLSGEFANEALNQQCRLDLAAVNGKISEMIVTKALLSAMGGTAGKAGKK